MKYLVLLIFSCLSLTAMSEDSRHGQFENQHSDRVWNAQTASWMTPMAFWQHYANNSGGRVWPAAKTYSNYDQVNEFDTFLVEVKEGVCLMEFFHQRWRRANDVRRWDERFNQFSGCATVFD